MARSAGVRRDGGDRAVHAGLAGLAHHHRVHQRAGGAGPHHPVARRTGAVRTGAVLRHRRLHGGADRPLHAAARRVRADRRRGGGGRAGGVPGRLPAGALPRHLLRHAEPGDVDDPVGRAGEVGDARLDRRLPRRGRHAVRLPAGGRGADAHAVLAGARLLGARRAAGGALLPHAGGRAGGAGARQRDPRRVSRHLGQPPHPPQAGDCRRAGRRRRRAGGARGRSMSIPTWRTGRRRAASCS